MASSTERFGFEWSRGLTPRRRLLMEICSRLDDEEIEQMLFTDKVCEICFEPKMGILDEGKLRQPLPKVLGGKGLRDFYFPGEDGSAPATFLLPNTGRRVQGRMSDYEICQSIVMTGLFSREQLGLSRLTQHELEVCERRYAEVRPLRCGCDFGSPTEAEFSDFVSSTGKYGDLVPVDGLTAVEHSFVTGKPVRTGYRRRSLQRVRARRHAYRNRHANSTTLTVVAKPREGFPMQDVSPVPVELSFNFVPFGRNSRPYRRVARDIRLSRKKTALVSKVVKHQVHYKVDKDLVLRPIIRYDYPSHNKPKYCYFRRKRGYYYHSIHHPYDDDIIPEGISRARDPT